MASTFVSFSGRSGEDKAFALRLIARLEEQGLNPWIYERRGGEVPPCAEIDEYCRKRIRQADHFIAVISESSIVSEHSRGEVAFAVATHGAANIIQVATACRPHEWPTPYSELRNYKRLQVGLHDEIQFERCMEDICAVAGALYSPPKSPAARLPLLRRLTDELRGACPDDPQYETGLFSDMRAIATRIAFDYAHSRLEDALLGMQWLISELSRAFPGHRFYYPAVIHAVLLAEVARKNAARLTAAEGLFSEILRDSSLGAKIDENAWAGLAGVLMLEGRYFEAFRNYRLALDFVRRHGRNDPDLIHNVLISAIASGWPLEPREVEELTTLELDQRVTQDPCLAERLAVLKALAYARLGENRKARECIAAAQYETSTVSDLLVRLAEELSSSVISSSAQSELDSLAERLFMLANDTSRGSPNTSLPYASFLYRRARATDALQLLHGLIRAWPDDPRFTIEAVWCWLALGKIDDARAYAERAANARLRPGNVPSAQQETVLYYRGLGNWLLGRLSMAARDFRDSGFGPEFEYTLVARNHRVLAPLPHELTN